MTNDNDQALFGIEGWLRGTMIAPITIPIWHRMTTTLPTAARSAEIQHRPPAHPTASPNTWDSCIPYFLGGGARICFVPGLLMPWLSSSGTRSWSPPFSAYSHPYNLSTATGTSPPPFLTSGNPVGRSVFPFTLSVTMKMAPTPHRPYSPCHQCPDNHDDPTTSHLDAQGAHPIHEHSPHAHQRHLHSHCSQQQYLILFISKSTCSKHTKWV